jgi:hypothetical protein
VLHYLAGVNYLDARLQPLLRRVGEPASISETHRLSVGAIGEALDRCEGPLPVVELAGDDAHGKQDVAALVAARCGLTLYAIGCGDVPANAHELEALAALWEREAALLESALLIECPDDASLPAARRLADRIHGLVAIASREPVALARATLRHRIDKPSRTEQRQLWEQALGSAAEGAAVDAVAASSG